MIRSVDHFVITVASVEATCAFYEKALGFRRHDEANRPTALHFGSQKINVHEVGRTFDPKALKPTAGAADFCLVADRPLADIQSHLQACNIAIEVGPVQRTGARGAMTSIYFRDPDGNLVEVSEYPGQR
jgi:catechol 2,3-dioxygenase-like lactoylglutathione lyase family enzyme